MTEKRRPRKPKAPWWETGRRSEHVFTFRHAEKHYLIWTCTKCGASLKLEEDRKPHENLFRNEIEEDCSEEIVAKVDALVKAHEWSWKEARPGSWSKSATTWIVWRCSVCGTALKESVLSSEASGVVDGTFRRLKPFSVTMYRKKETEDCGLVLAKKVMGS